MAIRRVEGKKPAPAKTQSAPAPKNTAKPASAKPPQRLDTVSRGAQRLQGGSTRHVALPSIAPGEPNPGLVKPGPLSLRSKAAKDAIAKSMAALGNSGGMRAIGYQPRSVEVDELGMTHVRLDRTYQGIPLFGEQVVSHLRAGEVALINGDQQEPTVSAAAMADPKLTEDDALAIAQKQFKALPEEKPVVQEVLVKNAAGKYVRAYRVELFNIADEKFQPRRQNYLVDANTGKVLDQWNQIDAFIDEDDLKRVKGKLNTRNTEEPKAVSGTDAPAAAIEDGATVSSKITFEDDVSIEKAKLKLDIDHQWKGDLVITLTSPSGKSEVLFDRKPGKAGDLKGEFDLSGFEGESTKGEWTLTVEDKAARDTGTFNSWALDFSGKDNTPKPPDKRDDNTLYVGKVEAGATQREDGKYVLRDGERGKGVITRDAKNGSSASGAVDLEDDNNIWGEETDSVRQRSAVDAQYGAQMTYDFYKNILGRDSIDGKGEALISNVHIRKNYVNAYWDGRQMHYGDGDGKNATELTSLDVAGHEITHGLTERTAGLIYRNESGGLNEAMSDIMGKGVEWYAAQQNPNVKFSWNVGETVWTPGKPGDALRYMDDPTKDDYSVDNYKNYPKQTEVHGSSGIANNAFVLLVQGGTNRTSGIEVKDGIGMEKSLKVFYRALSSYMTPSTTFAQARTATVQAATDLYGADSVEVAKVKEAWTAVGVN